MLRAYFKILSLQQIAFFALVLLAFSLPFEMRSPWFSWAVFRLTNLELLLGFLIVVALLTAVRSKEPEFNKLRMFPHPNPPPKGEGTKTPPPLGWGLGGGAKLPTAWSGLWGLIVLALIVTAVLAPEFQINALKAAVRMIAGLGLALATLQLVQTRKQLAWIVVALVAGIFVSVSMGLAELIYGPVVTSWLQPFRPGPTLVGPFPRLTGSFNHANQTAMFIEATLPFIILLWGAFQRTGRYFSAIVIIILLLSLISGVLLTYSRAAIATIVLANLVTAVLIWHYHSSPARRRAYLWLGLAGILLMAVVAHVGLNPVFRMRLSSEDDRDWYQVHLSVPEQFETTAGETTMITISVYNNGSLTWSGTGPNPVQVGGRWYRQSDNKRLAAEVRWLLDAPVAPGQQLTLHIPVKAPLNPGPYRLEWDLVQEHIAWFSQKSGRWADSQVWVTAVPPGQEPPDAELETFFTPPPYTPPIPRRLVLWHIAGQQLLDRPWLGIGLDNFRLTYGRFLDLPHWDDTIHANNWYLETAVSLGLLGSLPFFTWLGLLLRDLVRTVRRPTVTQRQLALATALFAYFIHGWFDYFLMAHSTGLLFWLLVGLWVSQRSCPETQGV